ncbi:MAG TPA: hypothetical protein ENN22_14635 [bacterium]|nr:hypothetical protein [bacterium]
MNPHYIIDGYNFIYDIPRFRKAMDTTLELSRELLVSFLRGYLSVHKVKITLVFDGDAKSINQPQFRSDVRMSVVYSKYPQKADDLIKQIIERQKNKKSLFLVSKDTELITFSKHHGANVIAPFQFFSLAESHAGQDMMDQKYNPTLSEAELTEWLKIFGEDKSDSDDQQ